MGKEKFPFRINTVRTDRGHEFQARFHWHVEDQGIGMCMLKIERSHRTDKEKFYQLLTYKDDIDLNEKLEAWEQFYNYHRPQSSHGGKTPYEVMRSLIV